MLRSSEDAIGQCMGDGREFSGVSRSESKLAICFGVAVMVGLCMKAHMWVQQGDASSVYLCVCYCAVGSMWQSDFEIENDKQPQCLQLLCAGFSNNIVSDQPFVLLPAALTISCSSQFEHSVKQPNNQYMMCL